jgi:glycosyltransferase involved in cell wall biosynthesis
VWILIDPREPPPAIDIPREAIVLAAAPPGPALLWGRLLGPSWIEAAAPDLFHATFLAPPRVPRFRPWVATIFDLIPLRHPSCFPWRQRVVFGVSLRKAAAAPRVVAVSRFTADLVQQKFGVPTERISVIPPPVDVASYSSPQRRGVPGLDRPYLLHLGGFDPLKGVTDLLLPAFARLARERADLVLVLTGDGQSRASAQRAARDLAVPERVHFTGYLDDAAQVAAVAGAGAVVVSSHEEGFGLPVAEGLAAGVPVAIGPAAAAREAGAGLAALATEGTPEALARAIVEALASGGPESSAGRERRAAARRFDIDEVAAQMLAVYREILSGRG